VFRTNVQTAPTHWWSAGRIWQLSAVLVALATGLIVALAPLGTLGTEGGGSATATNDGGVITFTAVPHRVNLWDQMGHGVLAIVAVPVILTLIPLPFRGTAHVVVSWLAAMLMGLGCVVALLSVGVFYLPTGLLLLVAALLATLQRTSAAA
jgi:hypothetical protein